jgi:hypothetical protein
MINLGRKTQEILKKNHKKNKIKLTSQKHTLNTFTLTEKDQTQIWWQD